jgi:hypothetical protein
MGLKFGIPKGHIIDLMAAIKDPGSAATRALQRPAQAFVGAIHEL